MNAAAELLSRTEAAILLAGFATLAGGIWLRQNRGPRRLGGRISFVKAAWLSYAIILWFAVPLLLLDQGPAFLWLAASMIIRALIEIPLCLTGKWRVAYGVTHDLIHALLVSAALLWSSIPGFAPWGWLTLVSLASELLFVRWFVQATSGPGEGIYFVPGGEEFRAINRNTALLFLPQAACLIAILLTAIRTNSPPAGS